MSEAASSDAPLASRATLRTDLAAGATVALVGLPQCLAYAMMSGLPPAYGLSTAAIAGIVAALASRCAQVTTGPTNTTGLLVLAALGPWLGSDGTVRDMAVLATLTLMVGLVRVAGSYAGAAKLLRFLPASVLVGFLTGAGILIGAMQIDEALGATGVRAGGLLEEVRSLAAAFPDRGPRWPALVATAATVAVIVGTERVAVRFPGALVAVAAGTALAWALDLDAASGLPVLADRATVPARWPEPALPSTDPDVYLHFLLPSVAISLLGTLELAAAAGASGAKPDMPREIRAQGWANVAGAFGGAFPASASLARSALLRLGGARTRLAPLVAAVLMVPALLFGAPLAAHIPQACLAGVLFVIAFRMIDRPRIRRMWKMGGQTRALLGVTTVLTLVLPLEQAIVAGSALGLAIYLAKTTSPRVRALVPEDGRLRPMAEGERPARVVVEVSGDLHYAAVSAFAREARRAIVGSAKLVVIDLSHAHHMRYAALAALEELRDELAARDVELRLAGVPDGLLRVARKASSTLSMTPEDPEPGTSVQRALDRE